jgi:hypothetical protein
LCYDKNELKVISIGVRFISFYFLSFPFLRKRRKEKEGLTLTPDLGNQDQKAPKKQT